MGKKLPLLISTLTLCASSLAPAIAWADEPERTAWSYEEMAALNIEIESEINEHCDADDPMCRDSYVYQKSGDIYHALNHYREHGLTVTAINPNNHTIRVAYDPSILSMWSSEELTVKDLYMVQAEVGYEVGDYTNAINNHDAIALEHLKVLFAKNDADPGDTWLPKSTEVEISVPDLAPVSSLASSSENYRSEPSIPTKYKSIINVGYRASNLFAAWSDQFDFSRCLENLGENMECRVMYESNTIFYAAVEVENTTSDNPTDNSENIPVDSSAENSENSPTDVQPDIASDASGTTGDVTSSTNDTSETTSEDPSTPETGQNMTGNQTEVSEISWWPGALIASGIAAIFLAIGAKIKKILKKSQKI